MDERPPPSLLEKTLPLRGAMAKACGYDLALQVLQSQAGYYLGTWQDGPVTRESVQYWPTREKAEQAISNGMWTQRHNL